jgi:hypothetical protein
MELQMPVKIIVNEEEETLVELVEIGLKLKHINYLRKDGKAYFKATAKHLSGGTKVNKYKIRFNFFSPRLNREPAEYETGVPTYT